MDFDRTKFCLSFVEVSKSVRCRSTFQIRNPLIAIFRPILALHGFYPSNIRVGSLVLFVCNVLIFELFVIYFAAPNAVLYRGANIAFITFSVVLINIFVSITILYT